ncbi:hypothetical protein FNU76_11720 [Chitinimonas arctica]|uniref:Lipoyl-binding domain-containing protein n=1 Tax=Chitinimonas arctica TaxID=2594795 RepID=A0A516SFN6_9NEIS|nr:hypothetical protein [Chitinimonas arctica]QDQ26977.1 hypothetical protein FNU76_11720 [Chitinimonas arctica]
MPVTTHLVCAPDDLLPPAMVMEWLVPPGREVAADTPLVRLAVAGEPHLVLTPIAGILTEHCVALGEPLGASDLLAMIEAEEPEFGMALIAAEDADDNLRIPACRLGGGQAPQEWDGDALALCAALGLSPDEVPCAGRRLARQDVERHVRQELRALDAARELLRR